MQNLSFEQGLDWVRDWIPAVAILASAVFTAPFVKKLVSRFIPANATDAARFFLAAGFALAINEAPLPARLQVTMSGAAYVLVVVTLVWGLRRLSFAGIDWLTSQNLPALQEGFVPLLRNIITLFALFTGAIMVLKRFDYDVMSLLTALGVGSLAVGLAAKETLSNMISGFTLIIDQNMRPGDRISLSGSVGDVQEIGLRSTRLSMPDGTMLIVPNSELVNTKILNYSLPTRRMSCAAEFRLPLTQSYAEVEALLLEAAMSVKSRAATPLPSVALKGIEPGIQVVSIGFWVEDFSASSQAVSQLNQAVWALSSKGKIKLADALRNS